MKLVGQDKIQAIFKVFLEKKSIPHCVFYGPSGVGKTTYARQIADELKANFFEFDAANFSIEKLRKIILDNQLFKPLIFIDEIHRLNKATQDVLLKPLEKNDFYFLAASTQNPHNYLTPALISRLLFFHFEPLSKKDLAQILDNSGLKISDDAKEFLINSSANDARNMLNLLNSAKHFGEISLDILKALRKDFRINYSDESYLISALIKSMRASDVNASLLYLARLIQTGASELYLARRLVIFASEDVGNANPNALVLCSSALNAVQNIGFPEARILLSQCVVFCAKSKKSNASYKAINKALEFVATQSEIKIPNYLKNQHEEIKDYIYPHDEPQKSQKMAYDCPEFYKDFGIGYEKNFALWKKEGLYKC